MYYILKSLSIYRRSMWLQTVIEHMRRSTWICQLRELVDALGGHCGGKIHFSPPAQPVSFAGGSQHRAYGHTAIMETDWTTGGVYRDTWRTEMDCTTGSIYLRHPGVDRHHRITHDAMSTFPAHGSTFSCKALKTQRTLCGSWCTPADHSYNDAICVVSHGQAPIQIFSPTSYTPWARLSFHQEFLWDAVRGAAQCWRCALRLLTPLFHHTANLWTYSCT